MTIKRRTQMNIYGEEHVFMETVCTKTDMSSVCGMHYDEYWKAVHIDKTMSQEDFDKWLHENCCKCRNMSDICMYGE